MAWKRKNKDFADFKPDPTGATWLKTAKLTQLQRLRLAKWGCYILTLLLALVVQDVIMSQFRFFGATTDLAVCVILLITVIEGTETGSIFVLLAALFFYFSGSAPGAYSIALLSFLGITATMLRQMYWHRSNGSIILCSALALMAYELSLFAVGLFYELTAPERIFSFLLTGLYSSALMIPLYPLIHKIGLIGGNTWKE